MADVNTWPEPMRTLIVNILVTVATLILIALLGELILRELVSSGEFQDYAHPKKNVKSGHVYAPRFIKSQNPRLFVEFDPTDPQVNALGMRGALPSQVKARGVTRIAVLGDSVAFGYGLSDEQSFPRVMEASLNQEGNHVETLNFGVCGYGLEAYPEVYRLKARQFKPDLVILAYILNDPAPTEAVFTAIGSEMKQTSRLKHIAQVSVLAAWVNDLASKAMDNYQSTKQFNEGYFKPENQQVISGRLAELYHLTQADGVPLVVFIFPYFHNMQHYQLQGVHDVINNLLQQQGIAHHDLLEDYRSFDGPSLRLEPADYAHPNAEGQRIAAEAIEKYLKQNKML